MQQPPLKYQIGSLASLVVVMWVVEYLDVYHLHTLDAYGIKPRAMQGLWGILFAPFLHGGFGHLIANTFR